MSERIIRLCVWFDAHVCHKPYGFLLPFRWTICLAADFAYGWGPDAADWATRANLFHRWLDRRLALSVATRQGDT